MYIKSASATSFKCKITQFAKLIPLAFSPNVYRARVPQEDGKEEDNVFYMFLEWSEGQKAMKRKMDNARLNSSKSVLRSQVRFYESEV